MEAALHLAAEVLTEDDDEREEEDNRKSKQDYEGPVVCGVVVEIQRHRRAYHRYENEVYEGEHIVLLRFQICEEKHDTYGHTAEANYRNYEECEADFKQNVN